ncbi:MAG: hypothetical protein IJR85_04975 [Synergistaceae bacterium]|nr:hypothetical protein [Synergistaceae bacterium]
MKRVILCVMMLAWSSLACADIQEFRYFSLDVPDGWTATEDGAVVTVTDDAKISSLAITADSPEGRSIEELAVLFSRELNGSDPEKDEDGAYTFEFDGGDSQAVIDGDEDLYLMIIGKGIEKNGEVMAEILGSLEMK